MHRDPHKSKALENTPIKWKLPSPLSGSHHCLIATQGGILIKSRWSLAHLMQWGYGSDMKEREEKEIEKYKTKALWSKAGGVRFC